jgi:hypothetical protein
MHRFGQLGNSQVERQPRDADAAGTNQATLQRLQNQRFRELRRENEERIRRKEEQVLQSQTAAAEAKRENLKLHKAIKQRTFDTQRLKQELSNDYGKAKFDVAESEIRENPFAFQRSLEPLDPDPAGALGDLEKKLKMNLREDLTKGKRACPYSLGIELEGMAAGRMGKGRGGSYQSNQELTVWSQLNDINQQETKQTFNNLNEAKTIHSRPSNAEREQTGVVERLIRLPSIADNIRGVGDTFERNRKVRFQRPPVRLEPRSEPFTSPNQMAMAFDSPPFNKLTHGKQTRHPEPILIKNESKATTNQGQFSKDEGNFDFELMERQIKNSQNDFLISNVASGKLANLTKHDYGKRKTKKRAVDTSKQGNSMVSQSRRQSISVPAAELQRFQSRDTIQFDPVLIHRLFQ